MRAPAIDHQIGKVAVRPQAAICLTAEAAAGRSAPSQEAAIHGHLPSPIPPPDPYGKRSTRVASCDVGGGVKVGSIEVRVPCSSAASSANGSARCGGSLGLKGETPPGTGALRAGCPSPLKIRGADEPAREVLRDGIAVAGLLSSRGRSPRKMNAFQDLRGKPEIGSGPPTGIRPAAGEGIPQTHRPGPGSPVGGVALVRESRRSC